MNKIQQQCLQHESKALTAQLETHITERNNPKTLFLMAKYLAYFMTVL